MAAEKTIRWRLGLVAIVGTALVIGSGFMACASSETLFQDAGGAGGSGASGGTCDVAQCPDPPFTGLEKCCTNTGVCGVRSAAMGTCYPPGQSGSGGAGGMGGMGGGKL